MCWQFFARQYGEIVKAVRAVRAIREYFLQLLSGVEADTEIRSISQKFWVKLFTKSFKKNDFL